jgi:hypothetical protein
MNVTKAEQKQITRATAQGRGALLKTLAILHRSASKRSQNAINEAIEQANAWDCFTMVNGALLHNSELA